MLWQLLTLLQLLLLLHLWLKCRSQFRLLHPLLSMLLFELLSLRSTWLVGVDVVVVGVIVVAVIRFVVGVKRFAR